MVFNAKDRTDLNLDGPNYIQNSQGIFRITLTYAQDYYTMLTANLPIITSAERFCKR